ncbi:UNKNOWN [Stylonychia lemnae]|uniref:Uncharacterized protein n=1 Tax=Stylonychia lemnae TaxID=5949 RepID=A0A078ALV1_STYLE|nr:UNKNOWN [Stylonychia lemnae]|eukprot:CDW83204.1 UNKNOWN [Stylonychia lemnae]
MNNQIKGITQSFLKKLEELEQSNYRDFDIIPQSETTAIFQNNIYSKSQLIEQNFDFRDDDIQEFSQTEEKTIPNIIVHNNFKKLSKVRGKQQFDFQKSEQAENVQRIKNQSTKQEQLDIIHQFKISIFSEIIKKTYSSDHSQQTYLTALSIFERVFQNINLDLFYNNPSFDFLYILGIAAYQVSSKYWDIYPLSISELSQEFGISKRCVVEIEKLLLIEIKFLIRSEPVEKDHVTILQEIIQQITNEQSMNKQIKACDLQEY